MTRDRADAAGQALLAHLEAQPRVRDFLERALEAGRTSSAYLFLGATGSGAGDAARALAQALLCDERGCGRCDTCVRVARGTHPDVHVLEPESAMGYIITQIRELLGDVALAPIRAHRKVYIITRADLLRPNSANALLKTLEEPPDGVTFILIGASTDTILPTIVSRCQCVLFRTVPPTEVAAIVSRATGLPEGRCRIAAAIAGSPSAAQEYLRSAARQDARRQIVHAIDALPGADEADILAAAKALMAAVRAPLAEVASTQRAVLERDADYLSRGAMKQLEDRNKRELNAHERSAIMEVLASARSLLRDVLLCAESMSTDIVNEDVRDVIDRLASVAGPVGAARALQSVAAAERHIARNVTPQLAFEVMLFDIRKALLCQ
ncbi:DNA polymerase III, delta prime subunit [Coriobacterium glomerans PW2]|uniref:DNA polymerase III subunit delta' n=1 Tax=Coriobacterium glomerans (strain ATCC 49209 / DSM 20642 / JCM 10262 / PW2) TaxID=700015 RepID=F2N773_CORGP|nr:DNA polymerase III subunit [Coriobacterium glomerans]AEB06548.1 DNA polymerase III, delta prime subunit [Coriobacterium glomerans PW2]